MDALEFVRERNRMCRFFGDGCYNCPANKDTKYCMALDWEEIVPIVEKWSAEHPCKTRQSVFLEQHPNARLESQNIQNILCICPADVFGDAICPRNEKNNHTRCDFCRHKFWLQEVE